MVDVRHVRDALITQYPQMEWSPRWEVDYAVVELGGWLGGVEEERELNPCRENQQDRDNWEVPWTDPE